MRKKPFHLSGPPDPWIDVRIWPLPDGAGATPGPDTKVALRISHADEVIFESSIFPAQMKYNPSELVSDLYRACPLPHGCILMTGTGIVPGSDFMLHSGDAIAIAIDGMDTLINTVS